MDRPKLPTMVVTGGPHDGTAVVLEALAVEKLLGSAGTCHARLPAGNVATVHARVVWDERGVVVSDAGSETGTYVNGERIGDQHLLNDDDRLFLEPPGSKDTVKLLVMIPARALSHAAISIKAAPPDAGGQEPIVLDTDKPLPGIQAAPAHGKGALDLPPIKIAAPKPPVASPLRHRPPVTPAPMKSQPPSPPATSSHSAAGSTRPGAAATVTPA